MKYSIWNFNGNYDSQKPESWGNSRLKPNIEISHDVTNQKMTIQLGIPTQYVAGLLPKANATFAPLSIAFSTLSWVNSFGKLDFSVTTASTECAKLFARKNAESSSATNGIDGNRLPNSAARKMEGKKERSINNYLRWLEELCIPIMNTKNA